MKVKLKNNLNYIIVADLYEPDKNAPVIIFSHGFKSGRHSPRNMFISEALNKNGFSTFLLDFTGHGESEGTLDESTTIQQSEDLKYCIDFLEEKGFTKIGLSGSSFGGASALMRTAEDKRVNALILRYSTMNACFNFAKPCYELADKITVPTMLIVGENDHPILEENQQFLDMLGVDKELVIVPGAIHAFEEPDQLEVAMEASLRWYEKYL